jgi:predicted transposase YbfD/YdcC
MLTNDKRAHDVAVAVSKWQLEHVKGNKENPVQVNIYAVYRNNYTEMLRAIVDDEDFKEITTTKKKKNAPALDNKERAHTLAVSITKWQLDNINLDKADKDNPVRINVYAIYKKNYKDFLNTLNEDTMFAE